MGEGHWAAPPESAVSADELAGPDAHRVLAALRAEAPVTWVPAVQRYIVTSYDLVVEALRTPTVYTVDDPRFTTAQVVGPSMLSLDGEQHRRHRDPFALGFRRSRSYGEYRALIEGLVAELVQNLRGAVGTGSHTTVDLQAQIARPLAVSTIRIILGLETVSERTLLDWYGQIVDAVDALTRSGDHDQAASEVLTAGRGAYQHLEAAVHRAASAPATGLGQLAADSGLSLTELGANAAVTLFGAIETSEAMTANALYHLLAPSEAQRGLTAATLWGHLGASVNPSAAIAQIVEESLRLEPAAASVDRYTTEATVLGPYRIPHRAPVQLSLAAANRDPHMFDYPDRVELTRSNTAQHLSFVVGPHTCIGMHVARLETTLVVEALHQTFPQIELVDPVAALPRGLVFRKPQAVLVEVR